MIHTEKKQKKNDIAISVQNVSKMFRIPHERIQTLRGAFVNMFRKKTFETFRALDAISFEVRKGEFFGIVGRNGSGKSTLLKILAGVYVADTGSVVVNGAISPFLELGIGFNPELSGRDNIYLNATVLGMTQKEIDEKFDEIVAFSELERFIDQKLKNYSSGMHVRLAFSVAIHANRDILLMDEVLAVGDANFQSKCMAEFMKHRARGRTIIFVTHDMSAVQKYCDRAMLLRDGKMIRIGLPDDVCNTYIEQNITDEQKRLRDEQSKIESVPSLKDMQKKVEIISAQFLDEEGEIRDVFKTGDQFSIQIKFKINTPVSVCNIGVGIHSVTGGQVFGYNTQMDNHVVDIERETVTLQFDTLPILKGDYYLNVVCFGDVEEQYYDVKPRYKNIRMYTTGHKYRYRGFLDMDHKWLP